MVNWMRKKGMAKAEIESVNTKAIERLARQGDVTMEEKSFLKRDKVPGLQVLENPPPSLKRTCGKTEET